MKILIITQHFHPDQFRINEISKQLSNRGHKVKILTGLPDYTFSRIPSKYKQKSFRNEIFGGVQIHRVKTLERGNGAIRRFLNYLSFAVSGFFYAMFKEEDFDLAFVYQTSPVTMAIPAIKACKKYNRKLIIYCLDLWPESCKAMNLQKLPFLYKIVHHLSKKIYQSADKIAITSKPFMDYLVKTNEVDPKRIVYIPQHGEDMLKTQTDFSDEYKNYYNFLFAGNIGTIQDVECIVKAAHRISEYDMPIKIHIVGDGSNFSEIKNLVEKLNLVETVILHGRHPLSSMPDFYSMADCFILTLTGNSLIGKTVPAKLQSYMSMGKPIAAAIGGAASEIIEEVDFGICVDSGDSDGLADAFVKIYENRELYRQKGTNARLYYEENFTLDVFMDRLEKLMEKLV